VEAPAGGEGVDEGESAASGGVRSGVLGAGNVRGAGVLDSDEYAVEDEGDRDEEFLGSVGRSGGPVGCSMALVASSLVRSTASSRQGWSAPRSSATKVRAGLTWLGVAVKRWEIMGACPRRGGHIVSG
jgi:hypothetical protein